MISRSLQFTNYLRVTGVFRCANKRYSMSWSRIQCLLSLQKTCCLLNQQFCSFNTDVYHNKDVSMPTTTHSDEIFFSPDMLKVKAMPFNLQEGGKHIISILKKTAASVVVIFVRTSVLAKELVKELNENHFNAKVPNESLQFDVNKFGQSVFVVSDKKSVMVFPPPADLLIQVQAPLCGVDVMKQRLHLSNFTSPLAEAVVLYNSNDIDFITKLGQNVEVTNAHESISQDVSTQVKKQAITREVEVNLPTVDKEMVKSPAVSRKVKTTLFKPVYSHQRTKIARSSFVDRVRLYVIAGSGGNGSPRTGARGGDGGDVILECRSKATLRHFRFKENRRPKAGHGQHCCIEAKRVSGQRGEDLVIPVPLGTIVKDERTGHVIVDMNTLGQQVKVVSGGSGGSSMTSAGGGEKGERRMIILEYKMYTDVGLVGFPNAGKSSLLRAISNAKPDVAEYAFTSLSPTLGRVKFDDFSQLTVVDLPGLIEGAHQNKGLGLKFLRHIERARILIFVVDVNGFQLSPKHPTRTAFETICLLANELSLYREELSTKPKILVLNKMDCVGAPDKYRIIQEKSGDLTFSGELSAIDELVPGEVVPARNMENIKMPKDFKFDHVFAVSALTRTGIDKIVSKLQELISKFK